MEPYLSPNYWNEKILPSDFNIPIVRPGRYLVNGVVADSPEMQREVFSPIILSDGERHFAPRIGTVVNLDEEFSLEALHAAENSYANGLGDWAQMPLAKRVEQLQKFVSMCKPLERTFALLEMWEIGKTYQDCCNEFNRTIKYIEDTIDACRNLENANDNIFAVEEVVAQIRRFPLGIVLCMGPFNYPFNETAAMLIPALLMGNSVVLKPHEMGSLSTNCFLQVFADCFPPGVVNIIYGEGATIIPPIMQTGKIAALGFIGSSIVANRIIEKHPRNNRLRTILGLEAKNPAFIFPDADLKLAAEQCVYGAFEFNGQRCTAIKHIWVHEDIVEEFLEIFVAEVDRLKCGYPWENEIFITPLAEKGKVDYLDILVEDALHKGAKIINKRGGKHIGNLYFPTLIYPATVDMDIFKVEQFGPVLPISTFSSRADLCSYLSEAAYGQQASIFSESPYAAGNLIDILVNHVCRINLNSRCQRSPDELPFTGRKDSAEGTLSIADALRAFSIRSLVVANQNGRDLYFNILGKRTSKFLKI